MSDVDRAFLELWSREWVTAHDPARDRPLDDEVRAGWLGFPPATPQRLAAAERRLGCVLPPSLRAFLLVTDGWKHAGNFIHRLAGTAELDWMRDTDSVSWADAYDDEVIARSLRLSLDGDASVLFLDPHDVGADGEWAAYRLASWSGVGPQRHESFAALMYDLYAGFHALRRPPGETRDRWDAAVERARRAALTGEVDAPAAVLAEAQRFGRERARVLRLQLYAMQGDWHTVSLPNVVLPDPDVVDAALFDAELLPLLYVREPWMHSAGAFALDRLRRTAGERIARYEARRAEPGFRQAFGNAGFDAAVRQIVTDLAAALPPAGATSRGGPGRRAVLDRAWPRLLAAMSLWRPVSEDHIAPVVLFTEPLLAELITPGRGRALLSVPRG